MHIIVDTIMYLLQFIADNEITIRIQIINKLLSYDIFFLSYLKINYY